MMKVSKSAYTQRGFVTNFKLTCVLSQESYIKAPLLRQFNIQFSFDKMMRAYIILPALFFVLFAIAEDCTLPNVRL